MTTSAFPQFKRRFLPLFEKLEASHNDDSVNVPAPPRRFNWHALRHFAVSCWIEAGLTPKTVQTFAGHASLQVTMDRYGHLMPGSESEAATLLDGYLDAEATWLDSSFGCHWRTQWRIALTALADSAC